MAEQDSWDETQEADPDYWYRPEVATFGDRLTAAREQTGLSQADLARKLGVKKATLIGWEDDLNEPRANRLQMLSGLLGVSLRWLLTGEGQDVDAEPSPDADLSLLSEIREIRSQMLEASQRLAKLEKRLRSTETS